MRSGFLEPFEVRSVRSRSLIIGATNGATKYSDEHLTVTSDSRCSVSARSECDRGADSGRDRAYLLTGPIAVHGLS